MGFIFIFFFIANINLHKFLSIQESSGASDDQGKAALGFWLGHHQGLYCWEHTQLLHTAQRKLKCQETADCFLTYILM